MNAIKLFISIGFISSLALWSSCKDESLNPVPAWETGVHGEAILKENMSLSDLSKAGKFTHAWNSVDKLNTVTKIEFYVYWDEAYTDKDGNSRTARHGGFIFDDPGKLLKSVTPKGNREYVEYTVTLAEIYNLYKDTKFDYKDGNGSVTVIDGVKRTATAPFNSKDKFTIRWALTTADGRVFERWNPDICPGTVPGLNCSLEIPAK